LVGQLREFEFLSKELLVGYELCCSEQSNRSIPQSALGRAIEKLGMQACMRRTFARADGLEVSDSDDAVLARELSLAIRAGV
jgi:hypothetical protein